MLIGLRKQLEEQGRDGIWQEFEGRYQKVEYQILTKEMEIIGPCWPNAKIFYEIGGSGRRIEGSNVMALKKLEGFDSFSKNLGRFLEG